MWISAVSIFRLKLISLKFIQFHQFQFCHQSLHIFLLPPTCIFNCSWMFLFLWVLIHYSVKCHFTGINCVHFMFIFLYFHSPFHPPLSFFSLPSLPPLVSISPRDAGPQLCGVPVLLPTWAERLFPPGPRPGTNDRAVPGRRWPLPRIQPQRQVGGRTVAWNNGYEYSRALCTSWLQKFGLQLWLLAFNAAGPLHVAGHTVTGEQGEQCRQSEVLGPSEFLWCASKHKKFRQKFFAATDRLVECDDQPFLCWCFAV